MKGMNGGMKGGKMPMPKPMMNGKKGTMSSMPAAEKVMKEEMGRMCGQGMMKKGK